MLRVHVRLWMCVKDRFAGPTLSKHDRAIALYEWPARNWAITIRNMRNYATSEKVKSQGKCAVAARQATRLHPPAPREFLLTFSGRALTEICVSRAKIEELLHIDVSIIIRKNLFIRYWMSKLRKRKIRTILLKSKRLIKYKSENNFVGL